MGGTQGRSPGVRIPPPLHYVAFFVAGVVLDRVVPLPFAAHPLVASVGWAFVLASVVLAALAFKEFAVARTTVRTDRAASSLVTGGIFRLTRNPLYLSLLLLYIGASLAQGLWWPLILSWGLVMTMTRYVIAREEQHLCERFGPAYTDYCRRVRRWL